jgi:Xaa-Pro aminopeptidase
MNKQSNDVAGTDAPVPAVMTMRQRAETINRSLHGRLETLLPAAMRAQGLDMWLILCQEDNPDPVFTTLIPMDTWCPILQILVFYDRGDAQGVEHINISGTNTHDLYTRPYAGQLEQKQWPLLRQIIEERDPQHIGINIGATSWAAGGLTYNLYQQLLAQLPPGYAGRLVSAEPLATQWLSTLTDEEVQNFEGVVTLAKGLIGECFSRRAITPGVTTTADLVWYYWQLCADRGLEVAFKPYFSIVRRERDRARWGAADSVIRPGDVVHCDVGIRYLRLNSDHQQLAYILGPDEDDVPAGLRRLMSEAHRLQDIYMAEFAHGLTGNELLQRILARARAEGVPNPRVYSHSLGLFLHEPGPLIGLPWEQGACPGRGDVRLDYNNCFTMELAVAAPAPEWDGQVVSLGLEEDVVYTRDGCRLLGERQRAFHLV